LQGGGGGRKVWLLKRAEIDDMRDQENPSALPEKTKPPFTKRKHLPHRVAERERTGVPKKNQGSLSYGGAYGPREEGTTSQQ